MTTGNTTLLGLALPVQGELDGTWGDAVNNQITSLVDSAVAGTTTLSVDADVELTTTVLAANQARQAVLLWTASNGATTRNITAPARSKAYIVINAGTGSIVLRGAGIPPTTGVTIVSGERCVAAWNGSDFVKVATSVVDGVSTFSGGTTGLTPNTATSGAVTLSGTLAVANGGTGTATPALVQGANITITGTWPNQTIAAAAPGTGTVTAVSVATANGLAGTSSGGATPALTLSTSVTGVVKGNGTALSAASAGTDYVAPGTATNFTALQTFTGTSSNLAAKLLNAKEAVTVSATAATGTVNYDVTTQSVLFYTTDASGNWTLNVRASSGTSLDSALSTGESVTIAFLVTQGATAYYQSGFQVDGSAVTPQWQGGTTPAAGNPSGVDIYVATIIKTASATFSVFASQTRFA
jgi:hypothetical protein